MKKLFTLFLSLIIFCSTNVYANEEIVENTSSNIDVLKVGDANGDDNVLSEIVIPTENEEKGEIGEGEESENSTNDVQISPSDAKLGESSSDKEEKVADENKNELLSVPSSSESSIDNTVNQITDGEQTVEDSMDNTPVDETLSNQINEEATVALKSVPEGENNDLNEPNDINSEVENTETNEETLLQKAKVTFRKVDPNGKLLPGAIMQILDSEGKIIAEWETTDEPYEIELSAGEYTIHEEREPMGYEKAVDGKFKVNVIINEDVVGTVTNYTNPTGGKSQLYYITINDSEEKYEVYCINQGLKTPDGNEYSGKILTPDQIRKFTLQDTEVDILDENGKRHYTLVTGVKYPGFYADSELKENFDVSDPTMSNQQLYDKTLDIIYHRNMIAEKFPDMNLTETEIRYITEWALKNYLNAQITTEYETIRKLVYPYHYNYYVGEDGQPLYDENNLPITKDENDNPLTGDTWWRLDHKFYYREYVYIYRPGYTGTTAGAVNDVIISPGNGDSFGQIAKGMSQANREKYAKLYYYLIGDDDNDGKPDHPKDMQLYMYSPILEEGVELDTPYQNVLGIAGFFKDIKILGDDVEVTDKYSTEKVSVTIKKNWDDNDNQDGKRPENIEVTLSNGTKVTLNEENKWTATIDNLPKYNNGEKIEYTWTEADIEGYELTDIKVEGYVTTLTNYHKPEVMEISVLKDWIDDNNESGKRPKTVIITLLADGKYCDEYEFNADEDWFHTFTNLPVYVEGRKIEYTVIEEEENIPDGYVPSYEGDAIDGFVVHNGLGQGDIEPPPENPQTGNNVSLYLITLLISIIGFIIGKAYLNKFEY